MGWRAGKRGWSFAGPALFACRACGGDDGEGRVRKSGGVAKGAKRAKRRIAAKRGVHVGVKQASKRLVDPAGQRGTASASALVSALASNGASNGASAPTPAVASLRVLASGASAGAGAGGSAGVSVSVGAGAGFGGEGPGGVRESGAAAVAAAGAGSGGEGLRGLWEVGPDAGVAAATAWEDGGERGRAMADHAAGRARGRGAGRDDRLIVQRASVSGAPGGTAAQFRRARCDSWTQEEVLHFLDVLTDTLNVSEAARACGRSRSGAYRKKAIDPGFADAWQAAIDMGYAELEMLLLRELTQGSRIEEDVQDGAGAVTKRRVKRFRDLRTAMAMLDRHAARMDAHRAKEGSADGPQGERAGEKLRKVLEEIRRRRAMEERSD